MMNKENTALQMIAEAARCPDYGPDMVKALMEKLDMNEKGFALLMNVSPSTVRLWTSGAAQPPAGGRDDLPENMIQQTELPQIHLIRDTDLGVFAYELHILAGDFLRESEFNLRTLATNTGVDSIAIMGKRHMWLSDAVFAYCSTGDLRQMALTTEYIGARAFLFHADRKEDGRT